MPVAGRAVSRGSAVRTVSAENAETMLQQEHPDPDEIAGHSLSSASVASNCARSALRGRLLCRDRESAIDGYGEAESILG